MPPKGDSKWDFLEGEDMARNRESGTYYAVKAFLGMPNLFKSLRTDDKREARRRLAHAIREHLEKFGAGKHKAGRVPTVSELIEEIERTESPRLRAKTQAKRKYYFARIREEMGLGHIPMDHFTLGLFTSRLEKVKQKRTRKTYWDYFKHANILNRYAYEQKYVSHRQTFPHTDKKSTVGTVLSVDEIKALWAVMNETTRDQFALSYECCMRLREMLHLAWDRVDLESGEITLRAADVKTGSKTGRGRTFIATENALERLRERRARFDDWGGTKWVFPSPTGKGPVDDNKIAWNKAKATVLKGDEKRGIKPMPHFQHWVRWHDLRHTAISRMLVEQKVNITLVSEYVGTSVSTLQKVYLHSKAEHTKGVTAALRITGE